MRRKAGFGRNWGREALISDKHRLHVYEDLILRGIAAGTGAEGAVCSSG